MSNLSEACPHLSPLPMTKPWGYWKGKTKNVWLKRVWQKLYCQNRNVIGILHGPPGSGKSTTALALCEMIDPNFTTKNIVFNVSDFCDLLKKADAGELPAGSAILFEESGVAADSRAWHSEDNIMLSHIFQTFRPMNLIVLNTVPELSLADKRLSQLATCLIECKSIDYTRQRCKVRIYDPVHYDGKTGKWYKRSVGFQHRTEENFLRTFKFGDVYVHKPSRKILRDYEKTREAFSKDVIGGTTKQMKKRQEPKIQRVRLDEAKINEYVNKIIMDKDEFMKEDMVGVWQRFNIHAVQSKFSEDQIGLSNAKVIKAAVASRMKEIGFKVNF